MSSQIIINISAAPRGRGGSTVNAVGVQSIHGSFAWGGSPATATIVFVNNGAPNFCGQLIEIALGNHWFAGICKSDTANRSSRGGLREMTFVDLREFLSWDYVYCAFNMPIRRFVNGVWKKRYWHIYPWDFNTYTKTFTDAPLTAAQIVAALFSAPTVGSPWAWNLTGNGLFPNGLMNQPVYSFDCLNGVRLDAALNDISARGGLVYTLDPIKGANYRLVWMRKGYGLIPVLPPFDWPTNSDDRRLGISLSGNATNIRVVGERNRYLVLNVPLSPDWNTAWEQFLNSDALFVDIFQNEKDPVSGIAYTSFVGDTDQWQGANAAKVRALQITVAEYVELRNARDGLGDPFADHKKFSGHSRMDMPAALYIQSLVFRAYVPNVNSIPNIRGQAVGLDSVNILDTMPCRVTYDPASGGMEADPTTISDGNGVGIVRGMVFGQDLFDLVKPERVSATFFSVNNRPWTATSFQIDDSGEGQRFIIFDQPCFTSENLLTAVGGFQVLNASPKLVAASAQAALTFELEPYSYSLGSGGRDRAEYVSGLCAEYAGTPGNYEQILFAGGYTADEKAAVIASNLLLGQYTYASGGYKLVQKAGRPLGTPLTSMVDRVEVDFNPQGFLEVVDLTTERERAHFEPERDLERRTQQNSLFPGQSQLKQQAREFQRFGAGLKGMSRDLMNRFTQFLKGNFDDDMRPAWMNGSIPANTTLPAGTPVFGTPVDTTGGSPANARATYGANVASTDTVFIGVTQRDGEPAANQFMVKSAGETLCRVMGPVATGDPIGRSPNNGTDYATNGSYLVGGGTPSVGVALMAIAGSTVQLIKVRLGAGGGGGGGGGVNYQTANYTALPADNGKLISFNAATALTLTLPATPPSTTWFIAVECVAGGLTIARNGLNIDTAGANVALAQNQGVFIYTDGTNYFTMRGIGGGTSVMQFKIQSDAGDYWVCKTWDGTTLGSTNINVAKPYELRGGATAITSEVIRGITYTYTYALVGGEYVRTTSGSDGTATTDYISPSALAGTVIKAVPFATGISGVNYADTNEGGRAFGST